MMQSSKDRDGYDLTFVRILHFSPNRRISIKGEMCAGLVVILNVFGQNPVEMPFVQNYHVIEALPAD